MAAETDVRVVSSDVSESAGQSQAVAATASRRDAWLRRRKQSLRRMVVVLVLLAVWQAYVTITDVQSLLFPSPLEVWNALVDDIASTRIPDATFVTVRTLVIGTAAGLSVGFTLAALSILSRPGNDLLAVLTSVFTPLPSIAILPLAMIWFGLSTTALVVVIMNSTIWPVAINTDMGFRSVSPTVQRVGKNLGLSKPRMVVDVLFPAALPYLLSGLKTAWAFGWRTVVAAELVFGVAGGSAGLGWYINESRYFLNTSQVFAGLVVISALGILIDGFFRSLERITVERWGMTAATA